MAQASAGQVGTIATFPSGETRRLAPGASSIILKALIEQFAQHYLMNPAVILVSESRNKIVERDNSLMARIGLELRMDRDLPDLILADLGPPEPILVFAEAVATSGPITPRRKQALLDVAIAAGFPPKNVAFVTGFLDRDSAEAKRALPMLAWGSFAWFASEPDHLVYLDEKHRRTASRLYDLVRSSARPDGS